MSLVKKLQTNTLPTSIEFTGTKTYRHPKKFTLYDNYVPVDENTLVLKPLNNATVTLGEELAFQFQQIMPCCHRVIVRIKFPPIQWTGSTSLTYRRYFLAKLLNEVVWTSGDGTSELKRYQWLPEYIERYNVDDEKRQRQLDRYYMNQLPSVYGQMARNGFEARFELSSWILEKEGREITVQNINTALVCILRLSQLKDLVTATGPVVGDPSFVGVGPAALPKIDLLLPNYYLTSPEYNARVETLNSPGGVMMTIDHRELFHVADLAIGDNSLEQTLGKLRQVTLTLILLVRDKDEIAAGIEDNFLFDIQPDELYLKRGATYYLYPNSKTDLQKDVKFYKYPNQSIDSRFMYIDFGTCPDMNATSTTGLIDFTNITDCELIANWTTPLTRNIQIDMIRVGRHKIGVEGSIWNKYYGY